MTGEEETPTGAEGNHAGRGNAPPVAFRKRLQAFSHDNNLEFLFLFSKKQECFFENAT